MNISAGGPHILLFERDQQLAALLVSELQLAGYECHIARTAVEVFDAIARFSVRIVLINLAQAAASRREFWVALDTQRRGSGIQVFTFHCSNLASYGPRDPDDYSQASMADMEIDGMLGLMKLVDTVRARVPGGDGTAITMPRVPRTPPELQTNDNTSGSVRSRMTGTSLPQPPMNTTSSPPMPTMQGMSQPYLATSPATQLPGGDQTTYSDKIRAVLYPNPHSPNPHAWNSSENNNASPRYNSYAEPDATRSYTPQVLPSPTPAASSEISVLQRLASGQIYSSPGLAELSRLVNGNTGEANSSFAYESWRPEAMRSSTNIPTQVVPQSENLMLPYTPADSRPIQSNDPLGMISPVPPLPAHQTRPAQAEANIPNNYQTRPAQAEANIPNNYQTRPAQAEANIPNNYQVRPAQSEPATSELQERDHQLRASPIQDLPLERSAGSQVGHAMTIKPPDGFSRPKETRPRSIEPQSVSQPLQSQFPTQPPLASVVAVTSLTSSSSGLNAALSVPPQSVESMSPVSRENRTVPLTSEPPDRREGSEFGRRSDRSEAPLYQDIQQGKEIDESVDAQNAVILDILQSLPAIAKPSGQQEQAVQPQIHNGRATRSLGNVLLDGHLVPPDRLEVAQSIQRMLRGVDLNYQLGEILLMFKLLTPDQLLAASLLSYGLITTTQISALGHIRQELHAIGMEYDLENLVILFRILSSEQLREARSNMQN